MMILCGQSNRIWWYWAGKYPGAVGLLVSPSYLKRVPIDGCMPFALDNDAFTAWREEKPWDEQAWKSMLDHVRLTGRKPLWAAVPDVVTNREGTLAYWSLFSPEIQSRGWSTAFCVQDGMTPDDVPAGADVVFVGGSTEWKWKTVKMWSEFPRVHVARVNSPRRLEMCEKLGVESVDGTGWFREPSNPMKLPALERFFDSFRSYHNQHELFTDDP